MTDLQEKTVFELKEENEKLRKKWKRRKEQIALLAVLAIALGLVVGSLLGYQEGYHRALVDFHITRGYLI